MRPEVEIRGVVRRWGNSYAFRLRKADVDRLGLREGQEVRAHLVGYPSRIDLGKVPTFHGGGLAAKDRKTKAGEGYWMEWQERRNRA